LDYLENVDAIQLENKFSATLPSKDNEPYMHGLVKDSQLDKKSSKVAIREEPSMFDMEAGKVLLQHSENDHNLHVRAHCPESMTVSECHEDIQQADGNGNVLRYVSTYQQKFSDSFAKDWLNDEASDYSVARRILCCYHPLEPEMWMTVGAVLFQRNHHRVQRATAKCRGEAASHREL
jgi:hypothetical protein